MSCQACERRKRVHAIQMEGRQAALDGRMRADNPYSDDTERQYWEYGWIEENFMADIEEHRAVMDWVGTQLYYLVQEIDQMEIADSIQKPVRDRIVDQIATICQKLSEKLSGN